MSKKNNFPKLVASQVNVNAGGFSLHFRRSLSFMMASSHACFSSGVLAMQTNHLFLAVLWIFQPLFTMFPLLW